jgi:type I restriction enzyme S subunit
MINPNWSVRPLGDLFEIGAGKTMSAAARAGGEKTQFLRTSNVLWDEIDLTTVDEMAIPAREVRGKLLRKGDLLVCEGGDIGRAAVWNGEAETMSFQNHLHRLRPLVRDVEPRFYVFFLQSAFTQLGIFEGAGNNTTIPNLSRSRLAGLSVPYPAIDEQRDIVDALVRVRDAIKVHDRSIEVAQDLKNAAMQTLFTCGLQGEAQKETEVGLVPANWNVVSLGSLGRIGNGSTPKKSVNAYWDGGDYPWLTSGKIYEREIVEADHFVTEAALRECHLPIVEPGAILIAITGQGKTLGHCAVLRMQATVNQHVAYVSIDLNRADPSFVRGYLETQYEYFRQVGAGGGSTKGALTCAFLRNVSIPLPTALDEQRGIVAVLDAIDAKISLHRQKRAVIKSLFQTLLHQLMTGKIHVSQIDLSDRSPSVPTSAAA